MDEELCGKKLGEKPSYHQGKKKLYSTNRGMGFVRNTK